MVTASGSKHLTVIMEPCALPGKIKMIIFPWSVYPSSSGALMNMLEMDLIPPGSPSYHCWKVPSRPGCRDHCPEPEVLPHIAGKKTLTLTVFPVLSFSKCFYTILNTFGLGQCFSIIFCYAPPGRSKRFAPPNSPPTTVNRIIFL